MPEFEVNQEQALERYLKLTAIRGGSGAEREVAAAIVTELTAAGLDSSMIQFDGAERRTRLKGDCGNLIVDLPGSGEGPRVMLSAHMDTVPICLGSEPVVEGDYVSSSAPTGLGADDRSGCAAILTAAIERLRSNSKQCPPAVLVFTVQEEIGLEGARHLDVAKVGKVDRAFNFDGGTVEKVTHGAIGGERIDIVLIGIPAHAGVAPQNGASAIVMAAKAIADLEQRGWLGKVSQAEGEGTANVGVIQGGEATNVVTPEVRLRAEARSHDPAFRTRIVAEMRQAFQAAAASVQNVDGLGGRCQFESHVDYEAFQLSESDASVQALQEAIRSIGREPYCEVAGGGLDANWLNEHGIPAATVGCGQRNIHTADEQLHIGDYFAACQIATRLVGGHSV